MPKMLDISDYWGSWDERLPDETSVKFLDPSMITFIENMGRSLCIKAHGCTYLRDFTDTLEAVTEARRINKLIEDAHIEEES